MEVEVPEGYVRLGEAVRLTKVAEKTIRNWASKRAIGKRKVKGQVFYNRQDVETLAAKQAEMKIVQNPYGPPLATQLATVNADQFREVGTAIAAAIGEHIQRALPALAAESNPAPAPEAVPVGQKPRVTLREAVALGFQAEDLRARVKAGKLENVGTPHRYRFRRRDLDAL